MSAVRVPWSSASFLVYPGGLTILASTFALISIHVRRAWCGRPRLWSCVDLHRLSAGAAPRGASDAATSSRPALLALELRSPRFVIVRRRGPRLVRLAPGHRRRGLRAASASGCSCSSCNASSPPPSRCDIPLPAARLRPRGASGSSCSTCISNGGDWSAIVTIAWGSRSCSPGSPSTTGLRGRSASGSTSPPGLAIGGGLLWFFHDGNFDWILIAVVGLLYVALGDALGRSSWVVLGAWGFLQTAATSPTSGRTSPPLGFFFFPLFPFVSLSGLDEESERPRAPLGRSGRSSRSRASCSSALASVLSRGDPGRR